MARPIPPEYKSIVGDDPARFVRALRTSAGRLRAEGAMGELVNALAREEPMTALRVLAALRSILDHLEEELVRQARERAPRPATWQEIGDALQTSRQRVWNLYRGVIE